MSDNHEQLIHLQAARIEHSLLQHEGVVVRFKLSCQDPDLFSATPCQHQAPLVVAHGGREDFEGVLEGFVHWRLPLTAYGLYQDGLAEFWIADQ